MKKKYYLVAILLMLVGFAAVSTTLYLSGSTNIIGNKDNFKVYYSDAKVNGVQDLSIVESETSLVFSTELDTLGQTYVIEYDVTNSSKNYDADLEMVCTGGDEYLSVVNNFDDTTNLPATETRVGTLTLTLAKTYTGADYDVDIECTITANAVERTSLGTGTPADPVKVCKWEYEDLDGSGTLTVGDKYGYCDDQFYVITVADENVELLTAAALTSEYRQAKAGELAPYVNYMDSYEYPSHGTWTERKDLDIQTYSKDYIAPYVNGYVSYLQNLTGDSNISGDLITYDKLQEFNEGFYLKYDWFSLGEEELWWSKTFVNESYFNGYFVKDNFIYEGGIYYLEYNNGMVRPVITISKETLNTLTNTTPLEDAQTFCESKGYTIGLDYDESVAGFYSYNGSRYLCSSDEDYTCFGEVYDEDGNYLGPNDSCNW